MNKLLVLTGLLLCSVPVLAQSHKKIVPAAVLEGKVAIPVSPTLPGEESLTARERVERDMLMPTRRSRAAALQAAEDAGETPAVHGTAVGDEAAEGVPAVKAATSTRRTTYHRRSAAHRSSTAHRTTATKKKTATKTTARKPIVKKTATTKRRR